MKKTEKKEEGGLSGPEFARLVNNFYVSRGLDDQLNRIGLDVDLFNYVNAHAQSVKQRSKVAFIWICLNPLYWQYAKPMMEGARNFFLPGHDVDYYLWSDVPELDSTELNGVLGQTLDLNEQESIQKSVKDIRETPKLTIFPTEGTEWPMPTLMRYHLFLQQEEVLSTYDYIFYCDVDMQFANIVGDEILVDGLIATQNPMYVLDKSMWPPYEPNSASTAFIPRPGMVINDNGQPRFMPCYYAGGFQGGKADKFIQAMKVMRERIDQDFAKNYISIWNEESHWNRYLFENPPAAVLSPSYLYPDSLHNEYYIPRWGRNYIPKLITLTKKHSLKPLTPEEQANLSKIKPT